MKQSRLTFSKAFVMTVRLPTKNQVAQVASFKDKRDYAIATRQNRDGKYLNCTMGVRRYFP